MLNRLVLKNFKRHEHLDVSFTAGLNVIFGDNYKGKTTVFYAFLYAFGGPSMVPGGSARIDRVDAEGGKFKAEVTAYFSVAGKSYYVERSASKCNLYRTSVEGEPHGWIRMANSASNVAQELASILGFPVRRLADMKYAEQGLMGALLTLGAGELNKIVEEVAEVEIVNKALKGCADLVRTDNAKLEVLAPVDEAVLVEKKQQLAAAEGQAQDAAASLQVLQGELVSAEAELGRAREATHQARLNSEQVVESNRKAEAHNRNRAVTEQTLKLREERLTVLAQEVQPLRSELADLGPREAVEERLAAFTAERDEMSSTINQATLAAERRTQAERGVQQALAKAGQAVARLSAGNERTMALLGLEAEGEDTAHDLAKQLIEALAEEIDAASRTKEASNEALIEARSKVQRISQALKDAVCPECKRPFEEHNPEEMAKELETARETVASKEASVRAATATISRYAEEKRTLEGEINALVQAETESETAQHTLSNTPAASAELGSLQEKVKLANQHISACTTKLGQVINLTDRVAWLDSEHATVSAEVVRLVDQLREFKPMEIAEVPSLAGYMESQTAAQAQRDDLANRAQAAEQEKARASWAAETLKGEIAAAEELAKTAASVLKHRQDVADLQAYVRTNRDRFMAEVWDGVLAQASQFASNCSNGDIRSICRIDEEFCFDEGLAETLPVKGCASGAQRTFMGIGVKAALAMMMNTGFNTLLLDEPAADLRDERSVALVAALKATGQQVIIVSHSMADAALADNTIEIA